MLQGAMPRVERVVGMPAFPLSHALSEETAALRPVVRAVVACVLGEGRDHPDVEDCTHETLRRALEGQARLREGEALRPWVLGIARHVALDARRRRKRDRREDHGPAGDEGDAEAPIDRIADEAPGPDERAVSTERARRIALALQALGEPQRRAMILFHVEGQDYKAIAARLDVPMGTVATWLARGRRALADALGEEDIFRGVGPAPAGRVSGTVRT
jgi:RNA polymerase sigma factor (sigma-70 family)